MMLLNFHYLSLMGLVALTMFLNVPFGFLRAKSTKYSLMWFLYIHLPIPFIHILRQLLMQKTIIIPLLIIAAVTGQVYGGRLNRGKSGDIE